MSVGHALLLVCYYDSFKLHSKKVFIVKFDQQVTCVRVKMNRIGKIFSEEQKQGLSGGLLEWKTTEAGAKGDA